MNLCIYVYSWMLFINQKRTHSTMISPCLSLSAWKDKWKCIQINIKVDVRYKHVFVSILSLDPEDNQHELTSSPQVQPATGEISYNRLRRLCPPSPDSDHDDLVQKGHSS